MYCFKCGKKIRGITNKVRHSLAIRDKKYNYDCNKMSEVSVAEAKTWLARTFIDRDGKKQTYLWLLRLITPKPFIKINNRNHSKKSTGSDIRLRKLRDRKLTHRW